MANSTALDLIESALRVLQVKASDVDLTAEEANDALDALNAMIEAWSLDGFLLYHFTKQTFNAIPNANPITIGIGGDINIARPIDINELTFNASGTDIPVERLPYNDYSRIKLKSLKNNYPIYFYLDQTFPLSSLYLYPVPTAAISLTAYIKQAFTSFANLSAPVSLPPGYWRALKFSLAIELAPEYQTTAGDDVKNMALSAKSLIRRTNRQPSTLQSDLIYISNGGSRYNIYRDGK
jgi:hypothetical protein